MLVSGKSINITIGDRVIEVELLVVLMLISNVPKQYGVPEVTHSNNGLQPGYVVAKNLNNSLHVLFEKFHLLRLILKYSINLHHNISASTLQALPSGQDGIALTYKEASLLSAEFSPHKIQRNR